MAFPLAMQVTLFCEPVWPLLLSSTLLATGEDATGKVKLLSVSCFVLTYHTHLASSLISR